MTRRPAIVYCGHCLDSTRGKTAHGLIRFTERFDLESVIDPDHAGEDAGEFVTGTASGVPIVGSLDDALDPSDAEARPVLVLGLATDGGILPDHARDCVREAIKAGLDVVSGLHVFLSEDEEFSALAREHGVNLTDVRKPVPRERLHFYSGRISEVGSTRVLVLGTDCASGKRTTAWIVRNALVEAGTSAELIGTGQTAWMQGARYSICLDSLVNDFVAGEIEHALVSAWESDEPDVLVVEGQGALLHPAYPGGLELIAATRPDVILLQHVPGRETFDGFPDLPMPSIERQIAAVEILADKPVDAITINPTGLMETQRAWIAGALERDLDRPVVDLFNEGPDRLVALIRERSVSVREA